MWQACQAASRRAGRHSSSLPFTTCWHLTSVRCCPLPSICSQREALATPLDPVELRALREQYAALARPSWALSLGAFTQVRAGVAWALEGRMGKGYGRGVGTLVPVWVAAAWAGLHITSGAEPARWPALILLPVQGAVPAVQPPVQTAASQASAAAHPVPPPGLAF